MSHYGPESIAKDSIEGLHEVYEVNKKGRVPLNSLLNNVSRSKNFDLSNLSLLWTLLIPLGFYGPRSSWSDLELPDKTTC